MGTLLRLCSLLLAGLAATPDAQAARSYDSCSGYITALPATISTQGVWCLKQNLSTAQTTGAAITVASNNVTIDCNDFKLGGIAAGAGSLASGVFAEHRQNLTVRNCNVRGFQTGIALVGTGSGHLVEGNRLDQNLYIGIHLTGGNNRVLGNTVIDTGGHQSLGSAYGIHADAEVRGNLVSGVFVTAPSPSEVAGIMLSGSDHEVRENTVRGLVVDGTIAAISADGDRNSFIGNSVKGTGTGWGIRIGGEYAVCVRNSSRVFATHYAGCSMGSGNLPGP